MALFRKLLTPDRRQTQLAYRVKYWPWHELPDAGRSLVFFRKRFAYSKELLLTLCSPELDSMTWEGRKYKLVWAYNNMPTEQEWNKMPGCRLLVIELRCSPAIDSYAVAILSFDLPSERLAAHAKGEFV